MNMTYRQEHYTTLLLVILHFLIGVSIGASLLLTGGCTTTRTFPDGTVEVEALDPNALAAFVQLANGAMELIAAEQGSVVEEEEGDPNVETLVADMLSMQTILLRAQAIMEDGVTEDELVMLQDLYAQANALLERHGINIKVSTPRR